jgi:transposase
MLGKITPDFRTISDFRKDNRKALKNVFKEFNRYCDKIKLYSKEYISIDGSKFRAVNSKDNNFTQSKLDDRIKRLDGYIEDYLSQLEASDNENSENDTERKLSAQEVKDKISKLKERKVKYESIQKQLEISGESQISLYDPEARLMKSNNGGFDVSYNVQTAVDAGSHMIAGFEVTDHPTDHGLLQEVSQAVKDDFGLKTIEATSDKGYQNTSDMMNCLENGIIPHVIPARGKDGFDLETVYEEKAISAEQKASVESDDLKDCLRAGVIPDTYKDIITEIEIIEKQVTVANEPGSDQKELTEDEMKTKTAEGNFVRDEKRNMVYCPCNNILRQKSERTNGAKRYWNKLACARCKNKCTKSKYKVVHFSLGVSIVVCKSMQKNIDEEHSDVKQKRVEQKKERIKVVRLHLRVDQKKCCNRKCLSEHPFGTIKRTLDSSYFLLRGKEKTTAELSLSFLAYNIKRAIKIAGFKKMMAAFEY